MALPAILPCLTISRMIAAAFRAFSCPTSPCEELLGSRVSTSTPRPRICEWAAMRFIPRSSLAWGTVVIVYIASASLVQRYTLRNQLTAAILGLKEGIARLWRGAQNGAGGSKNFLASRVNTDLWQAHAICLRQSIKLHVVFYILKKAHNTTRVIRLPTCIPAYDKLK
jgi:hypothetical protein